MLQLCIFTPFVHGGGAAGMHFIESQMKCSWSGRLWVRLQHQSVGWGSQIFAKMNYCSVLIDTALHAVFSQDWVCSWTSDGHSGTVSFKSDNTSVVFKWKVKSIINRRNAHTKMEPRGILCCKTDLVHSKSMQSLHNMQVACRWWMLPWTLDKTRMDRWWSLEETTRIRNFEWIHPI